MAKRGDPEVLRLFVVWLRSIPNWTQATFAEACGVRQSDISRYENGIEAPSEEVLRRMATAVKVPWPVAVQVRRVFAATRYLADREAWEFLTAPDLGKAWGEVMTLALTSYFIEGTKDRVPVSVEDLRCNAQEIWTVLLPLPAERRLALLRAYPGDRGRWEALVERICTESVRAAADDPEEARRHAEFARAVASQASLERGHHALVLAYVWGFIGNARRVANELQEAKQAFLEVERHLKAGEEHTTELLDLSRLLDLEASLRKDEQRYPEALVLLDRARETLSEDRAIGHILLNKEHVLERMGDYEGALAVLAEAEPYIRKSGDSRLLLALHFNRADNLYHLGRYEEGASLMPTVRELAAEEGNALDLLRVRWLGGRLDVGLGKEEAVSALEEVKEAFTKRRLPYDAALSMLDLALILLKRREVSRVEELALETAWIFDAQGIRREALAALKLFCEAAEKKELSAAVIRRVRAEIECYC
jgi:transcriptional regulator with XRE-family HTH domain